MKVKEGVMQDSTFINSDPGHDRADKPRGPREGTWVKKGRKIILWL